MRASFLVLAAGLLGLAPACMPASPGGGGGRGGIDRLDREGDDGTDDDELAPPEFADGDGSGGGTDLPPPAYVDAGPGGSGSDSRDAGSPPPPPPPPPPPAADAGSGAPGGGGDLNTEERDLLDAINAERATRGLAPVAVDDRLQCAARRHAMDVGSSGDCGHVGSDGSWPWDRAMACGFPQETWTVNEIAAGPGFTDGADAVWGWSNSPGHYAALMHERARFGGFAVHNTCFIAVFDCCVAGSE